MCAICGRSAAGRHLDHDHDRDVIRAVLCQGCNGGIGQFEENPTWLRAAADYCERWGRLPRACPGCLAPVQGEICRYCDTNVLEAGENR